MSRFEQHEDLEQQLEYFGTPLNFTNSIKMRRLRRKGHSAELVAAWYAHMRDLAKQGTNFGRFKTDVESFVDSYGGEVPDVDDPAYFEWFKSRCQLWTDFEACGLVDIEGDITDLEQTFAVRVLDYDQTNKPRPLKPVPLSNAERQARYREKTKAENSRESNEGVTKSNDAVTSNATDRQTDIQTKERTSEPVQVPDPFAAPVDEIWNHWIETDGRNPNLFRGKAKRERLTRVRQRLKSGYSVEEIKAAVDHVCRSEWHRENGHTDLITVCRSDSKLAHYLSRLEAPGSGVQLSAEQRKAQRVKNLWGNDA